MEADDGLDELLDEVEKKFCRNVCVADTSEARDTDGQHSSSKRVEAMRSISEDVDALLEELLEDDDGDSSHPKREAFPTGPEVDEKPLAQVGGRRCCPVFVGGSSVTNGVGTATSNRCCDQLRCVSCDFRVLAFDDREWDPSCDYLFLRNNVPDRQKLGARLKKRRGFRAYACQCSWWSSSEISDLRLQPRLSWVCGRHPV